jgi:S-formylglutathione hydrolase FrmB
VYIGCATLVFGDVTKIATSANDVFWLASEAKRLDKKLPHLYLSCGTEDFIYEQTTYFAEHLKQLDIAFTYFEEAGVHEWGVWDRAVRNFLEWALKSFD